MLQARPVTSVDDIDPKFEAFHESDCGLVGEFDSVTKANVGCVIGTRKQILSAFHLFVNPSEYIGFR